MLGTAAGCQAGLLLNRDVSRLEIRGCSDECEAAISLFLRLPTVGGTSRAVFLVLLSSLVLDLPQASSAVCDESGSTMSNWGPFVS